MDQYVCWKDRSVLTDAVLAARSRSSDGNVVVLSAEFDEGDVQDRVRRTPRSGPVVLAVDQARLQDPNTEEMAMRAIAVARTVPIGERPEAPTTDAWSVVVRCPTDQCQNAFASDMEGVTDADGQVTVVGRPPTTDQSRLLDAAKELGPEKSLARIGDAAKYVIANITLVAAVVGGFGIFSDARGGFFDYPLLFGGVVVAAALAIVCAVAALLPRTEKSLDFDDLPSVAKAYRDAISHRAAWTKASMWFLLAGIALGSVVFFLPRYAHPVASLVANWDGSGERLILDATAKASGLPEDARVVVRVRGIDRAGRATLLTRQVTTGEDEGGTAAVTVKLPHRERFVEYRIRSTMQWAKKNGRFQERSVEELSTTVPPFEVPALAPVEAPSGAIATIDIWQSEDS